MRWCRGVGSVTCLRCCRAGPGVCRDSLWLAFDYPFFIISVCLPILRFAALFCLQCSHQAGATDAMIGRCGARALQPLCRRTSRRLFVSGVFAPCVCFGICEGVFCLHLCGVCLCGFCLSACNLGWLETCIMSCACAAGRQSAHAYDTTSFVLVVRHDVGSVGCRELAHVA